MEGGAEGEGGGEMEGGGGERQKATEVRRAGGSGAAMVMARREAAARAAAARDARRAGGGEEGGGEGSGSLGEPVAAGAGEGGGDARAAAVRCAARWPRASRRAAAVNTCHCVAVEVRGFFAALTWLIFAQDLRFQWRIPTSLRADLSECLCPIFLRRSKRKRKRSAVKTLSLGWLMAD